MKEKFKKHFDEFGGIYIVVTTVGMAVVVAASGVAMQKNHKNYLQGMLNLADCAHNTLFHEVLPEALKNLNSPSIT